jgi:hypothetical protein
VNSLPASNATNQLFGNAVAQNNQFSYQQQPQHPNEYFLNKSNSTSSSSLFNQSLNSSLSANQNNFLNNSNNNINNNNNKLSQSLNNEQEQHLNTVSLTPVKNIEEQVEEKRPTNEEEYAQKNDNNGMHQLDTNNEPTKETVSNLVKISKK